MSSLKIKRRGRFAITIEANDFSEVKRIVRELAMQFAKEELNHQK